MSVTIDSLEIKIATDSSKAANGIDELISSLRELRNICTGGAGLKDVASGLNQLNGELNRFNTTRAKKKLDELKKSADNAKDSMNIPKSGANLLDSSLGKDVEAGFDDVSDAMEKTKEAAKGVTDELEKTDKELKQKPKDAKGAGKAFDNVSKSAKNGAKGLSYFFNSLKRIIMYRGIYALMKTIENGMQEGASNAYQFARIMGNDVAKSMDEIADHTFRMKNQLGAMATEILTALTPILVKLADMINSVADRFTEIIAAFNGLPTYQKANLVGKVWEDAKDSLMEYKKQLLGLDELNVISNDAKANQPQYDYKDLYTDTPVSEDLKWLAEIKLKLQDVKFEFMQTGADVIESFKKYWNEALLGASLGFVLGGVPGAIIGSLTGVAISMGIEALNFLKEGDLDAATEAGNLADILTKMFSGGTIGFFATGSTTGALIGASLGAAAYIGLNKVLWENGRGKAYSKSTLGNRLIEALTPILGAFIGLAIGKGKGALLGFSIGSTVSMGLTSVYFKDWLDKTDTQTKVTDLLGIIGGATAGVVAFKASKGQGKNAVVTGIATASVIINIIDSIWKDESKSTMQKTIDSFASIVGGVIGAYIGYKFAGGTGAVWGFTIGASITVMLKDIAFELFESASKLQNKFNNWLNDTLGIDMSSTKAGTLGEVYKAAEVLDNAKGSTTPSSSTTVNSSTSQMYGSGYYSTEEILKRNGITIKANGGYVGGGHLFFANENGNPEYIGNMGGTTAVANSGQMAEAIEGASYRGMARALQQYGNQNGNNGYEPMSGDDMFVFLRKKAESYSQRTGTPAFN